MSPLNQGNHIGKLFATGRPFGKLPSGLHKSPAGAHSAAQPNTPTMTSQDIQKSFRNHQYTREVIESAGKRVGSPCMLKINPIDGVVIVTETPEGDRIVAMNAAEKSLILIALGQAYAEMCRL